MRVFYTIIIVVIVLFIISFSLQNATEVPLNYFDFLNTTMPAYMLMFIAFLAGVIVTGLLGFAERMNLTRTIRQLNKTIRDLRRELRATENYPKLEEKAEELDTTEP